MEASNSLNPLELRTAAAGQSDRANGKLHDFQIMFEKLPYGLAVYDSREILMINRAGAQMLGYQPQEMCGHSVFDFIHPESWQRVRDGLKNIKVNATPIPPERLTLYHRNGRMLIIESTALPCVHEERIVVQVVFREVTSELEARHDALQAREQLRRSEERYRRLVDLAEEGILTVDVNECIKFINHRMASALGFEPGELEGRCFLDFCEESAVARILEETANRLRGVSSSYELTLIDRHGKPLSFLLSARPLFNAAGEFEAALVVATDITRRVREEEESRRLEASIFQARRMESLGVLAGGIAHDFNNLLMGILGNASLARMEQSAGPKLSSFLDRIERGALRASDLTQQMLTYSGQGPGTKEAVNLACVVREMIDLLNSVISRRGLIHLDLNEQLPPVLADATQLRQVVMNLVTNASEALPENGGIITVRSSMMELSPHDISSMQINENVRPGTYICLEVDDNGIGIERTELDRIFEPFYSTRKMGRGLGLATVFGIVRGHGGTLRVSSSRGLGTSFSIFLQPSELPLRHNVTAAAVSEAEPPARVTGTILVIDDEELVLEVTRDLLQRRGFRVLTASNGMDAVDCFERYHAQVDAVVLDLSLPDMAADEVYLALCAIRPQIKVIVASGASEQSVDRVFGGMGLGGFLQKPYAPRELVRMLGEMITAT